MAALNYTLTKVGRTNVVGAEKEVTYDLTCDTGDYAAGGNDFTAAQFGLKKFKSVFACGSATGGTAGATAQVLGFRFNSANTVVTLQQYEAAASGAPPLEKTAEAVVANFAVRLVAKGV